jgi:hypothetical protein
VSSYKKENSGSDRTPSKEESGSSSSSSTSSQKESSIHKSEEVKSSGQKGKSITVKESESVGIGYHKIKYGDDLLREEKLEYAMKKSAIEYLPKETISEYNSSSKPFTSLMEGANPLEGESLHLVKLQDNDLNNNEIESNKAQLDENDYDETKTTKEGFNTNTYIRSSYFQMYFKGYNSNNFKYVLFNDLKKPIDYYFKDSFLGKIENTRDGYLLGRIVKIEGDLNFISTELFNDIFSNNSEFRSMLDENTWDKIDTMLEEIKEWDNFGDDNLEVTKFIFKKNGNTILHYIDQLNEHYEQNDIGDKKLQIETVYLDFWDEVDEDVFEYFEQVLECISKFDILILSFYFSKGKCRKDVFERILEFISQNWVKYLHFRGSTFDIEVLWSSYYTISNTKCRFEKCYFNLDDELEKVGQENITFQEIDFVKCWASSPDWENTCIFSPLSLFLKFIIDSLLNTRGLWKIIEDTLGFWFNTYNFFSDSHWPSLKGIK